VADIQRMAAAELSPASRVGHTLLLAASLTVATGVGSLWATEPVLPVRTHLAFGVIVGMAMTWAAFAAWVLTRRRVLLGADRVLSATIGLIFSALATAGMLAVGSWGGVGRPAYLGALMNAGLCACATALLIRARRRLEMLSRNRRDVEDRLQPVR
jgi:hypothetical protein